MQKQATIQQQENSKVTELEQRREKFKKVDIKMTLETAKNSVNRAQNGENTQKKD